jgi:hypothetical protein
MATPAEPFRKNARAEKKATIPSPHSFVRAPASVRRQRYFSIEAWLKPSSLIGEPHRMRFTFSRDVTLSIEITTQGV